MSDKEMPEKIWATPDTPETKNFGNYGAEKTIYMQYATPYIREDSTQKESQVAKKFIDEVEAYANEKQEVTGSPKAICLVFAIQEVLSRWRQNDARENRS